MQKIDISKYVNLRDEPVSFMFTPTQAQQAANPNIPAVVKVDAEITVRLTTSSLTSDPSNDDHEETQREAEELQ